MAHGDYGDLNYQLAKLATDNRWRQSQSCIITDRNYVNNNSFELINNNNNNVEKFDINDPTAKLTGHGASGSSSASECSEEFNRSPSEWTRLRFLMKRCNLQLYRDWTVTHLKLLCHIVIGVILGLFYGDSGSNASKSFNNVGFLLIGVIYLWYTAMMPSVLKCK